MGWIKVTDRLPELDFPVLCWDGKNNYVAHRYHVEMGRWEISHSFGSFTIDPVTHWRWLPSDPDKE